MTSASRNSAYSSNTETILLSVEGNIGSGKSTLVGNLRRKFGDVDDICFLDEPVDEWEQIKDADGKTMLEKYYADQEKYAFSFQMMAYISRLARLRDAMRQNYRVIVTERNVFTDKMVFAAMLHDTKKIEDVNYAIYLKWFDEFLQDVPPVRLVYVRTDPEVAKARVDSRARQGESIPLGYLRDCHKYHERWLKPGDVAAGTHQMLVIDGNTDIIKEPKAVEEWIGDIDAFMGLSKN